MSHTDRLLLAELEDRIEQVFAAIEQLRDSLGNGKLRRELLSSIFRDVHSFKAVASANGFNHLAQLAHEFENLLHSLRVGRAILDDQVLNVFEETADALASGVDQVGTEHSNGKLVARLKELANTSVGRHQQDVDILLSSLPAEISESLSEEEKYRLGEAVGEGANLYLITTRFHVEDFDERFQNLKDRLRQEGEVLSTAPKIDDSRPDQIDFRILYSSDAQAQEIRAILSSFGNALVVHVVDANTTVPASNPPEPGLVRPSGLAQQEESGSSHYIRINLNDLDLVISNAHELYRKTASTLDRVFEAYPTESSASAKETLAEISESFLDLAADLVALRMVAIDRVLQRALRSGRAAALAAGKEVDFVLRGNDLMIDRSLSEAIADPLIHLVRNAVAHGIEAPEERENLNKYRRGNVLIEMSIVQGQTRLTVTDDGRGIDQARVSDAAAALGLVEHGAALSMEQSMRLIFRSGLSTADQVSGTSGRGVGLDAVESAIEMVGGAIRVSSVKGRGSAFEIRLPITFALLKVVKANVADRTYLLDTAHVVSCHRFVPDDVETSDSEKRVQVGDEFMSLQFLRELLMRPQKDQSDGRDQLLLVCQFRDDQKRELEKRAIVVDSLGEPQKVLVRNLGSHGSRWFGVAGASELRDGKVALLLDLPRLVYSSPK